MRKFVAGVAVVSMLGAAAARAEGEVVLPKSTMRAIVDEVDDRLLDAEVDAALCGADLDTARRYLAGA